MSFILDPSSNEPLYLQLQRAIQVAVSDGQFQDLTLPSSRSLASELGVSRTTVNLAYQELVAQGFIYSEPRSGFRVSADLVSFLHEHPVDAGTTTAVGGDGIPVWPSLLDLSSYHPNPLITKDPDWHKYRYPFVYGQVDPETFPVQAWMRALRTALDRPHINYSLRDAGSEDDPLLVEALCRSILPQRGIRATPDQILITNGAQQGLSLVASVLLNGDSRVAVENPGYADASQIFQRTGAHVEPIDVDSYGMKVEDVPSDVGVVSLTPSHQFPTNVTLSPSRRQYLLDFARSNDVIIVEDDYDSEFRYVGQPTPAIKAADEGFVIYLGSFSKFLAPGLRLGYIVAAPEFVSYLRRARRFSVRHPSGHAQRALALMINSGDYRRALQRHRSSLKDKWGRMVSGIRQELGWSVTPPTGGTSFWLRLPEGLDSDELESAAADAGIIVESGKSFYFDNRSRRDFIRLGYAAISADQIAPGLRLLSQVVASIHEK